MDLRQFNAELKKELQNTPVEMRLAVLKARLASVPDPEQRRLAEIFFEVGISVGPARPQDVVVLIHGIRTYATWEGIVRAQLERYENVITYPIGYGYFDVLRFWFPLYFRQQPVERVLRELRGIRARHRVDRICVVAHSFGTYVMSHVLAKHPDIDLHRLLLCGSVIRRTFRWDMLPSFPRDKVLNDCGSRDYWPVLAEGLSWGYGPSGTFGFQTHKVIDRFHDLGHSDFFQKDFIAKFWVPFIIDGTIRSSEWEQRRPPPPWWLTILSILPIKTLLLALILAATIRLLW